MVLPALTAPEMTINPDKSLVIRCRMYAWGIPSSASDSMLLATLRNTNTVPARVCITDTR
jgi:hypothetical protein